MVKDFEYRIHERGMGLYKKMGDAQPALFSKKDWNNYSFINPKGLKIYLFSKEDLMELFHNFEILKENESETTIWSLDKHIFFIELLMRKVKKK